MAKVVVLRGEPMDRSRHRLCVEAGCGVPLVGRQSRQRYVTRRNLHNEEAASERLTGGYIFPGREDQPARRPGRTHPRQRAFAGGRLGCPVPAAGDRRRDPAVAGLSFRLAVEVVHDEVHPWQQMRRFQRVCRRGPIAGQASGVHALAEVLHGKGGNFTLAGSMRSTMPMRSQ